MGVAKLKYDFPAYFAFEFDGKVMKHFMLAPTLDEIRSDLKEKPQEGDAEKILVTDVGEVPAKAPSKFFDDIRNFVGGMNSVYHVIYITSAIGTRVRTH